MNLLFVHDHKFYNNKNIFYSTGGLPGDIWRRYLKHFSYIVVIGRELHNRNSGLVKSSIEKVKFSLIKDYNSPLDEFSNSRKIDKHIIDSIKKVDAVIVRLPSILGFRAISLCKKINKPYAIEVVGCAWDSYWNYGNFRGKIMAFLSYYRMKKSILESKFTIYVTKSYLQNRYKTTGYSSFASNVEINDLIDNYKKNIKINQKTIFGMLGNIDIYYKGHEIVIKALASIKNNFPDFILYLAGNGNGKSINKFLKKYDLDNHVKILGPLKSGQEVFEFLDKLDMYLHPSLTEGLPRSLIEAMSRGCPALASSVGGIPELLDDKYLHQPGDYKVLANQIKLYARDKEELLLMSENNFNKSKDYEIKKININRDKFFEKFVSSF